MFVPNEGNVVDDPNRCFETLSDIDSAIHCGFIALSSSAADIARRPAYYYNRSLRKCIILVYFDTTLSLAARDGWTKYSL